MAQTTLDFSSNIVDGTASGSTGDNRLQVGDFVFIISAQGNWAANFDNGHFNFSEDSSVGSAGFSITITTASGNLVDFYDYQVSVQGVPAVVGIWPSGVIVDSTNWSSDGFRGGPGYYRAGFSDPSKIPAASPAASSVITDPIIPDTTTTGTMSFWLDNVTFETATGGPNVAPTLSATGSNPIFTKNGAAVDLFSGVAASTNNSGQTFESMTLTISNVGGVGETLGLGSTNLALTNGAKGAIAGVGLYSISLSGGVATVQLSGMLLSNTAMRNLVDGMTFSVTGDNPGSASRVVTITSIGDIGGSNYLTATNISSTVSMASVNSAPTGSATAVLAHGTEDAAYTVTAAQLLQGFTDADGDTLSVSGLTASGGATVINNGNDTYTITPVANFNGTVSLSYSVSDGHGGSKSASQSFVLDPTNDAPTGSATAILAHGSEDVAYTVTATQLLQGFSDIDGDTLSVSNLSASGGATVINNGNGNYTITPVANFNGTVSLSYSVIDGHGGSKPATQSFVLDPTNDAPTGSATAVLTHGTEDVAYTVTEAQLLQGFSDVDGDTLSVSNLIVSNGAVVTDNGDGTYTITPVKDFNETITLSYSVTDGHATSVPASQSFVFDPTSDDPTGTASAILIHGSEDTAYTVSAADLLQGFSDADGDTLSVSGLTASNGATVINNGDGTYTIKPVTDFNGTLTLSYSVEDGTGGSKAATQSVIFDGVNDDPTGSATANLTHGTEDTDYTVSAVDLLQGFSDIDGDTLSVSGLTASDGATVINNGDGTYTITPVTDFDGTLTLSYSVKDGNGGTKPATQSVIFDGVNDGPTGTAGAILVHGSEDKDYTVSAADLLQGFSDVDGDTLSVSGLAATGGATVTDNGDGTYTITPAADFNGAVTLSYSVGDGNGGTTPATQSVIFDAANDDPTGNATATLTHGTEDTDYTVSAANLLKGFSDVDGDSLSVAGLTASDGATVTDNGDGTYTIKPATDFNGTLTLSYSVEDGNGGSKLASQSIIFDAVNDAPTGTASAILVHGSEDKDYTVSAADLLQGFSDADGDTTSVSGLTASDGATVTNNGDGTYTITPVADFNGTLTLTYSVEDGNGKSKPATQSVIFDAVNDGPVGNATAALAHGTEDTAYTVSAADLLQGFSDVDGDTLSVSGLTASNGAGVINNGDGTYTITPAADFNGTLTLSYSVTDGNGGSAAGSQSVVIDPTSDDPTGTASAILVHGSEDTAYTVSAADLLQGFSDADGDTLSVSGLTASDGAAVTDNGDGTYTIKPAANFNGALTLSYSVEDGTGGSKAANQSVIFDAVNDGPTGTASGTLVHGREDTDYTVSATDLLQGFSDVDGDTLSVSGLTASGGAMVTDNGDGTYTIKPAADFNGTISLSYSVGDGNGSSKPASQSVIFDAVNDAPIGTASATLTHGTEDTAYTVSAADLLQGFSDVDGDTLSVSGLTASDGATVINNGDGTYTITPAADFNGAMTLSYSVGDGNGGSKAATQSVIFAATNDAPTGAASAALTHGSEDAAYTVSAADLLQGFSDVDGDTLSVSGLAATNGATVTDNRDGTYTITPATNFNGTLTLSYSVEDGNGGSKPATQSVIFDAVNDAPTGVASATLTHGTEETAYKVSAADLLQGFSDADGDTILVSGLTASDGATVTDNGDGTYTITPVADFNGALTLSYSVVDGHGGSEAATQSVTFDAINDAPTGAANAILTHGTEDTAYKVSASQLLQGFSDADGDTLLVSGLTASGGATVTDNGDGTYSIAPVADFNGAVTLSYSVVDGHGGSKAATQSVIFDAANDAPAGSATATLAHGTEDTAYVVQASQLLQGFSDVDGDTLSVSGLIASGGATVTDNGDGSYSVTPSANFNGALTLSYSVVDGHGGSKAASQSVIFDATNDTPTGNATATLAHGTEDIVYVVKAAQLLQGFSDADGDTLLVSALTASGGATVADNGDGSYSITPVANFNGAITLSYSVADGHGGSVAATQSIILDPVDDIPVANDDTGTMAEHSPTAFDVLGNDTDVESTLSVINPLVTSNNGSVTINGDGDLLVSYTGPGLEVGETAQIIVSYQASDGANSDGATLTVTVTGTYDAGETIDGSNKGDLLNGTKEGEAIKGFGGSDTINGGGGDDEISGGVGNDIIRGGKGNDNLRAGEGNDRVFGGAGNDRIVGWGGNDILTGGKGSDLFVFHVFDGKDTITDFQATGRNHDKIDFQAFGRFENFADVKAVMHEVGHDTVIDLPGHASITLLHVDMDTLTWRDFLF